MDRKQNQIMKKFIFDELLKINHPYQSSEDSSTSSSEDELVEKLIFRKKETYVKINRFVEDTVINYSNSVFKSHFRMTRSVLYSFIDILKPYYHQSEYKAGKPQVPIEKAVLLTIWYLANTESFRQISDRFGLSYSAAYNTLSHVMNSIVNLSSTYIKWPSTETRRIVSRKFRHLQYFKNCIGVIDGSHIAIPKPSNNQESYINRKCYHSLLLQCVALPDKSFCDVYCGEPGSLHDARVLRKSPLYRNAEDPNFMGIYYLLGDSAYPNLNWLITPFRDNGTLTEAQKKFNYLHSSNRVIVENALGLLKNRFRRLTFLSNFKMEVCINIIMSCCVLHNICIHKGDIDFESDTINIVQQEVGEQQGAEEILQENTRNEILRNIMSDM